jgi:hypothetical protein
MTWAHLAAFRQLGIQSIETGVVLSDLEDRDLRTRNEIVGGQERAQFIALATSFMSLVIFIQDIGPIIATCQDVREFFQRNPDVLLRLN